MGRAWRGKDRRKRKQWRKQTRLRILEYWFISLPAPATAEPQGCSATRWEEISFAFPPPSLLLLPRADFNLVPGFAIIYCTEHACMCDLSVSVIALCREGWRCAAWPGGGIGRLLLRHITTYGANKLVDLISYSSLSTPHRNETEHITDYGLVCRVGVRAWASEARGFVPGRKGGRGEPSGSKSGESQLTLIDLTGRITMQRRLSDSLGGLRT
jgi:hypothetical protein